MHRVQLVHFCYVLFSPSSSFFLCCQPHILKIVCNQLWYIFSPPTTIWCYNKHNMHVGMCSPFWVTVLIRVDRLQTLLLLPLHLPLRLYRQALFPPFLLSSTFDANYTICPPFVSWDLATSVLSPLSLSTFTHTVGYRRTFTCYCFQGVPPRIWQYLRLAACQIFSVVSKQNRVC